jgi:hypothetical protein
VGHREHERPLVAILELEQLGDAAASGAVPQLPWVHDRHRHLEPADRVHLVPQDLLDPAVHTPACGQVRPQPRAELAHEAGAHHEDVGDRLRVRGRILEHRQEVLRLAGHRGEA